MTTARSRVIGPIFAVPVLACFCGLSLPAAAARPGEVGRRIVDEARTRTTVEDGASGPQRLSSDSVGQFRDVGALHPQLRDAVVKAIGSDTLLKATRIAPNAVRIEDPAGTTSTIVSLKEGAIERATTSFDPHGQATTTATMLSDANGTPLKYDVYDYRADRRKTIAFDHEGRPAQLSTSRFAADQNGVSQERLESWQSLKVSEGDAWRGNEAVWGDRQTRGLKGVEFVKSVSEVLHWDSTLKAKVVDPSTVVIDDPAQATRTVVSKEGDFVRLAITSFDPSGNATSTLKILKDAKGAIRSFDLEDPGAGRRHVLAFEDGRLSERAMTTVRADRDGVKREQLDMWERVVQAHQ